MYNIKDPIGVWRQGGRYQFITGSHCEITLEERPHYCDRGRYLAKLFVDSSSELNLYVTHEDGWNPGRYYFDEERAKLEIEAGFRFESSWLGKLRRQVGAIAMTESKKPLQITEVYRVAEDPTFNEVRWGL